METLKKLEIIHDLEKILETFGSYLTVTYVKDINLILNCLISLAELLI